VFFYLSKLLFSGFLQFKGNFVRGQNTVTELLSDLNSSLNTKLDILTRKSFGTTYSAYTKYSLTEVGRNERVKKSVTKEQNLSISNNTSNTKDCVSLHLQTPRIEVNT